MTRKPVHDDPVPAVPDDDPETDRLLAGIGRFSPQRGFEDRVVGRVRVPLPRWLRTLRQHLHGLTSGVTGWTVLATFSLATAAAWTSVVVLSARYWGEIGAVWNQGARQVARVFRQDVLEWLELYPVLGSVRSAIGEWLGSVGLNMQTAAIGYGVVILVCVVALWRLTAEPHKTRGPVDAAS
jgi:hypothetical protein